MTQVHPDPDARPSGGLHLMVGDSGQGTTTAAMLWAVNAATRGHRVTVASTQEAEPDTWRRLANAAAGRHPGADRTDGDGALAATGDRLSVVDPRRMHEPGGAPMGVALAATPPGTWLVYDSLDDEQVQDVKHAAAHRPVYVLGTWHAPAHDAGDALALMYPVLHLVDTLTLVSTDHPDHRGTPTARELLDGLPGPRLLLHPVKDRHRPLAEQAVIPLAQDGRTR